jgi:thymidylate synthase (FAD)
MLKELKVLDKGYVRLITFDPHNMVDLVEAIEAGDMGLAQKLITNHDLAEVNAARASFGKSKTELDEKDVGLVNFLADAKPVPHTSPFRHNHVTLEVYAPLPVARQWWRHVVGAPTTEEGTPWSELSRRYVRGGVEYHIPEQFRKAPENSKQGSGGPIDDRTNDFARSLLTDVCDAAVSGYEQMLNLGIAAEQARLVLPQGVYTSWRWSPSVQALASFLEHRLAPDAQWEIRQYANAVLELTKPIFPLALEALV